MALAPGTRLGVYHVLAPLGAGGMGEVYRARDTRLDRDVALKILPEAFAAHPERFARFEREAKTLAALNHPHIAHVYGFESGAGANALVMELVEGEDLSQRLVRGPIALAEALPIARQIADALEAAHAQEIIHRDLKPANIKLRSDGTVKVLDFGLAKALDSPATAPTLSQSPTITTPAMTHAGVILGTAAYMAPEQARGEVVDKRADIWAFGCVLYEILTGTRAFDAAGITDLLAAVVRDEPDWGRLPANTPAAMRRLLHRSLRKDRRQRLAHMADARLDLEDAASEGPTRADDRMANGVPRWRERVWALVATASLAALAVVVGSSLRPRPADLGVVRFEVARPPGNSIDWGEPLSPDGHTLAFIGSAEGKSKIWVRPLASGAARPLAGTDGATRSFWSPDSRHVVAFFHDDDLKAVSIDGSAPRVIAAGPFRDGAWSASGVVLLGGQRGRPLMRVSERGGEPIAETKLDSSRAEVSHDYPEFLPDGQHYVYLARSGVRLDDFTTYVGTLGSSERRAMPGIRTAVKYSPTGHLLFLRGTTLMAQPFNADRLDVTGDAFPIAEQVAGSRVRTFRFQRTAPWP